MLSPVLDHTKAGQNCTVKSEEDSMTTKTFTLTFSMDNAAFEDGGNRVEISRILTTLAARLCRARDIRGPHQIRDINDNLIGKATIKL